MGELSDEIDREIKQLAESGDAHAEQREYDEAIAHYSRALELLPEPRHQWEAFTWLKVAMADAYFHAGLVEEMHAAMKDVVMMGPEENGGNPFIQLRYGQALLEVGDEILAADWLARAFLAEGESLFEDEDPKYLDFVLSKLRPPDGYESWQAFFDAERRKPWWKLW